MTKWQKQQCTHCTDKSFIINRLLQNKNGSFWLHGDKQLAIHLLTVLMQLFNVSSCCSGPLLTDKKNLFNK